jgi:VWFA-related protein
VIRLRLCFLLTSILYGHNLGPSAAVAQAPIVPPPSTTSSSDENTAPAVRVLNLIALGKDGQPVTDLKLEELRLFEDKVEQKIKALSPAAHEPLTIGLFFDVSRSRSADRYVSEETRVASEFVHSLWQTGDTAFLLAFNEKSFVLTQPTQKPEEIDEGLRQIPGRNSGSTALYDALCLVKPEKLAAMPGRKVYVTFSDFEDNSSSNKAECVLEAAREAGITIFPLIPSEDFGSSTSKRLEKLGKQHAQKIADQTGGEVLLPESHKQLALIFQRLATNLRSAYRITYLPASMSPQAGSKRGRIHLETTRDHVKLIYPKA